MKKTISIILNILSIASAVILSVFVAFFAYDWLRCSFTEYMFTVEFWWAMDINALCMFVPSLLGLAVTVPNIFIAASEKIKKTAKIMTIIFAAVVILSAIVYIQPLNFNFALDSLF